MGAPVCRRAAQLRRGGAWINELSVLSRRRAAAGDARTAQNNGGEPQRDGAAAQRGGTHACAAVSYTHLDFIGGNTKLIAKLRACARRAGMYQTTRNDFGQQVEQYGSIPLVDLGAKPGTNDPIVPILDSGDTGCTSLYACLLYTSPSAMQSSAHSLPARTLSGIILNTLSATWRTTGTRSALSLIHI